MFLLLAPLAAAVDPWTSAVLPRLQDGGRAFRPVPGGYTARLGDGAMVGHFDADGAVLALAGDAVSVRVAAWGRADAPVPTTDAAPALGACVPFREDAAGACIRRLEYATGGLREWWTATADGFEQGWEIAVAPKGGADLIVGRAPATP